MVIRFHRTGVVQLSVTAYNEAKDATEGAVGKQAQDANPGAKRTRDAVLDRSRDHHRHAGLPATRDFRLYGRRDHCVITA